MTSAKKPLPDYLKPQTGAQPNWEAFDSFTSAAPPPAAEEQRDGPGVLRTAGDMAIKGAQGVVGLGQSVVGVGSLATGGLVGKGMRAIGYDPQATKEFLGEFLSDEQKAADAAVQQEETFTGAIGATLANPRALAGSIVESLPGMIAGMGVASGAARAIGARAAAAYGGMGTEAGAAAAKAAIEKAGTKLMAIGAGTEGAQTAGRIADDAQAAGRTYGEYAPASVAAGLGTAAIGLGAGKLMGDAATEIATGARSTAIRGGLGARVGKGVLSEGVLEEMPQSAQEQVFTNIAQGEDDIGKGVANAAGMGLVTGGVMGGGMGMLQGSRNNAQPVPTPAPVPLPDTGPASRAANAVQAAAAAQTQAATPAPVQTPAADPAAVTTTTAPAALTLDQIDARLAQLHAIGRGTEATKSRGADGSLTVLPGVVPRPYTPEEKAEYSALMNARRERVAIPPDQQQEFNRMLAEEDAARAASTSQRMQQGADQVPPAAEPRPAPPPADLFAAAAAPAVPSAAEQDAEIARMIAAEEAQQRAEAEQANRALMDETNARVERDMLNRAAENRAALRARILNDASIPADQKKHAFQKAMADEGYTFPVLNEADHADIDRALTPVRTAPNELVDAVPERVDAPAPTPAGTNTAAVDAAIASGMRLKTANGTVLHKPGSSKIFKLSAAQRAYYLERTAAPAEAAAAAPPVAAEAEAAAQEQVPAVSEFDAAAHQAATSPTNDLPEPTQAQKDAGNYKVGRVKFQGLDLSIENPAGSTRKGVDRSGTPWETKMQQHYGYIRGTVGADKDHIDTFVGTNLDSGKVFVIDQVDPDSGKFDEHKVMLGFDSLDEARQAYQSNYDAGWTGGRNVTETTMDGFREWLASGKTKKPFAKLPRVVAPAASPAPAPETVPEAPAIPAAPAAPPAPQLTKVELNKMTVKDMSDAQLLQAREVFKGQAREPKIEKEIALRGLAAPPALVVDELVVDEKPQPSEMENRRVLADLAENAGNPIDTNGQFMPGVYGTPEQPLKFVSGMSAPGDFTKLFGRGKNVGISVLELSKPSIPKIAQQLADTPGAYLFVDSGAFSVHMGNVREADAAEKEGRQPAEPARLDHDATMRRYADLELALSKASDGQAMGRMFLVMPDVVGDQAASLRLVEEYAENIKGFGLQAIIPLQSGDLTLTEAYEQMMRHLGMDPGSDISPIIGIPTAEMAASNEELTALLRKYGDNIHGVHVLGAIADSTLQPRLDAIKAAGYDGNVSADANRLRSMTSKKRPRKQAMKDLQQSDTADAVRMPRLVRDAQRAEPAQPLSPLEQRARGAETVEDVREATAASSEYDARVMKDTPYVNTLYDAKLVLRAYFDRYLQQNPGADRPMPGTDGRNTFTMDKEGAPFTKDGEVRVNHNKDLVFDYRDLWKAAKAAQASQAPTPAGKPATETKDQLTFTLSSGEPATVEAGGKAATWDVLVGGETIGSYRMPGGVRLEGIAAATPAQRALVEDAAGQHLAMLKAQRKAQEQADEAEFKARRQAEQKAEAETQLPDLTAEQLAEKASALWGDMLSPARVSALHKAGIGQDDAQQARLLEWDKLGADLRQQMTENFNRLEGWTSEGNAAAVLGGENSLAGVNRRIAQLEQELVELQGHKKDAAAVGNDWAWDGQINRVTKALDGFKQARDRIQNPPAPSRFAGNKLFTEDRVAAARARMKSKLGTLNSGIDPELLMDGITIAGAYIESGVRSFSEYSAAMLTDLGEGVRPYLRSFYEGVRHYPGLDTKGMSTAAEIDALEQANQAPHTQPSTEKNEAIGTTVKAKPRAAKSAADPVLRLDWGVDHIDGYTPIPGGANEQTDYGLRGGVKDAFLKDAQGYLRKVSLGLQQMGFGARAGRNGKPEKIVNVSEGGPAVAGDVYLHMQNDELGLGVMVQVGASAMRGLTPTSRSGISVMMRVEGIDRRGDYMNNWMPVDLTASDLAERAAKLVRTTAENAARTVAKNVNPGNTETASTPAPTTTKETTDDSTPPTSPAALDPALAEGQRPAGSDTPARGARAPRARAGRADAGGVRKPRGRAEGSDDARGNLGNGAGDRAVSDRPAGPVERGGERVSADFRPAVGGLTRQGSWFDTAQRNVDLIELARKIEAEGRAATPAEQEQLSKYVGFGAGAIRNTLFPVPGAYAKQADPNRLIWPNLIGEARWRALAERLEALPPEWQRSVLQSSQYAHYTSENLVRSIWSAMQRLGFTGGKVFEPGMGIGSFAMLMPDTVRDTSKYTGIEFDGPTALIARLLSPEQHMLHDDFIKRKFPANFFDVAIGNPPFSQTKVFGDPDYEKHGFMLHDFFFAKSIDRVRPGGLLAFVTSKGTMDKQTDKARRYLAERADLVGAIRLPSTAFEGNAGTSVVTDVIFLRKRLPGEAPAGAPWNKVTTVDTKDGPVVINEYFAANPDMVLGQNRISGNVDDDGRRIAGNGLGERYTVVSYDKTPAELDAKFAAAVERLPENVYSVLTQSPESVRRETAKVDFDPRVKREGVVYLGEDGEVLRVEGGVGRPLAESMKMTAADRAWFTGYTKLRDLVQEARHAQATDGDWEPALARLNEAYDAFRAEHGPINDFRVQVRKSTDEEGKPVETETRIYKNRRRFREDYDAAILTQLETINEAGQIVKSPFLKDRTIGKPVDRDVKTVGDALAVSLDSIGRLDLDDVGRRIGLSRDEAIDALGDQVYKTPAGEWQLADEYLSGNVVEKLEEAEQAARLDETLKRNVEALKAVQPEKLGPSQISAKLGASWVPVEHVNAFAREIGAGAVTFDNITETWQVDGGNLRSGRRAGAEYGTAARSPSELLEAALNSRTVKITFQDQDKKTVTDVEATTAANEMLKKIKDKFKGWVWTDAERASELMEAYNHRFNNIAPRRFDGSHLTLPGVSMRYKLHPHQKRAIWRTIQTGDTYLMHSVGSGKTIEMIASGMEQKRLGLIKKPIYVVPNHMLEQFSNEFMELYPLANIMVADDENFTAERRKAFIANATLNNPDAIIITHDAFQRIGVKEETVAPIRDEILMDLEIELSETAKDNGARVRRSQLEQQIEAVTQRFDRIIGAGGKDSTIKFEDIGADFIFADEAHAYRKLDFHTAQQIKGIDPNGSKRALDMYVKTRYLQKQRPGRAMVFASGTAVTNTMGELYTIMRFFAPDELDRAGISTFDAWSRQFGEVAPALEPNAAGKYELVERFARFDNVPELMARVRQFMDVLTSDQLGALVKRPDLIGGKPNLNIVMPSEDLESYMTDVLGPRIEKSKAWKPTKDQPNNPDPIVSIITDGRFAAIDPRFFGGKLGEEGSIITTMGDKVVAAYHAGAGNVYLDKNDNPEPIKGSTQIVFYNLGFGEQSQKSRGFNSRAAFTKRLTDGGIPRDQIAWFDDATTDAKKEAVFKAMRSGEIRVLIGSAKKMGTGVNVQKRLAVLHYQDPPWFPADVEQPHGRIIRQGNQNGEVAIEWYTTKGTYQSTMWQMVARKQRFIDQAFTGDKNMRSMEDMGEASLFEQAAAVASGDPRAIQLAGLKQDVERFERLQAAHANEQINVRSSLRSAEWDVDGMRKRIATYEPALAVLGGRMFTFVSGTVGRTAYDKPGEFGQAVKDAFNQVAADNALATKPVLEQQIAELAPGVTVTVDGEPARRADEETPPDFSLYVKVGDLSLHVITAQSFGASVDAVGLARRIFNQVNSIDTDLRRFKSNLASSETDVVKLRKKLGAPFEYQQDLAEKYAELKRLEAELRAEGEQKPAAPAVVNADGSTAADAAPAPEAFDPPQLEVASSEAEYFRGDSFAPAAPAGATDAAPVPLELGGAEFLQAKKAAHQLNQRLEKEGVAPVRALRVAPTANFALARQVGAALGIEVNYVAKTPDFDGVAYQGVAYLAEGMRNPELAIAGHETLHALEQTNPELGAKLRGQIRAYLKDGVVEDRQMREYAANGFQDVTTAQAEAEVIADINGAMWLDPRFWADLAKADSSLFRTVAYKFMELASKVVGSLRGSRFDVDALVKDVAAVRAIMVSTWAEHNAGRDRAAPAAAAPAARPSPAAWAAAERSVPPEQQLSEQQLYAIADEALAGLDNTPPLFVLDSPDFLASHGIRVGAVPVAAGAMIEGKIFLFRNGIRDAAAARATIWHELFHHGLRKLMTPEAYSAAMTKLYNSDSAVKAMADRWTRTEDAALRQANGVSVTDMHLLSVEEALANLAEQLRADGYQRVGVRPMHRTVRKVIVWMADLADQLRLPSIARSLRAMTLSKGERFIASIFSRASAGERSQAPSMAELDGHSINFREADNGPAFSRTGLADALTGAAGNIADVRLPAGYLVGDLFNRSGKLSWWHKTIGTMDNLARRQPAFAKVYDAVQAFLGDVSRFAVVAADMAPNLLPKLEAWRDLLKKPLSAEDTKAIGAPIFEGTLVWARDANGKPVKIAELEAQAASLSTEEKARILLQKGIIDDQQNQAWMRNPLNFYESVINNKFEATQLQAGVVWTDAELRSMFSLTDGQIAVYREFRAAIDKSLSNLTITEMVKMGGKDAKPMLEAALAEPDLAAAAALLRDHFVQLARENPEKTDMHLDTAKQIMNLADRGQDLMDRGYAPLSRFGRHTVYVQQDNEQLYFGMFETHYEASKMARQMGADHPGAEVLQGTVSEDAYKLFEGVAPETIELFGSMVGLDSQADAASTEVYQTYLKMAKANRSALKRLIQRKGIAGFSEDAGRVLAGFIYSNARLAAGNAHLGEVDEAVTEIPKQEGELIDAAMQLREQIRNPQNKGNLLGGLMFAQFLGGSVASAMVNMTQPLTMTLPFLSQYGGLRKAGARITAAVGDMLKGETGDAGLDAALQWAADEGIVAPQEIHYLQAQASGKGSLQSGDGTRAGDARARLNNAMAKVSLGWGKLFAVAELTNRRITFIAAYRTAVEEGMPDPARFAQETVTQTQGMYNSGNKPRWARGAIGSLLMTFKQYSISYMELLSRMAFAGEPGSKERRAGRRAALYMLAVLFVMGGADGLPFAQDLEDAIDGILQRLGYNFSTKRKKQEFFVDVLGEGGADFALKGVSSLPGMPIDVAGRFGMGNLIPGTGMLTKKESYTRDLGELAGPAGDLVKRAFSASGKALGGDIGGAALEISPGAVRNAAKGLEMAGTGEYKDTRGYTVNETTLIEAAMKTIGFQPNSTADVQDVKGQVLNMLSQTRMRQDEIAEHWARGIAKNDQAMIGEARAWREDWNRKNPEAPVRISMPGIRRRVLAMRQEALDRVQKTAPAALKAAVRTELAGTRE
jgi:N12 class adenine-specific DNA methylase